MFAYGFCLRSKLHTFVEDLVCSVMAWFLAVSQLIASVGVVISAMSFFLQLLFTANICMYVHS